jgi:hypothetical protein
MSTCGHEREMCVSSAGLTRHVCESCGRMRFAGDNELTSAIAREMFARPADDMSAMVVDLKNRDRVLAVA